MRLKRFIKSLVNSVLFLPNIILWLFDIRSVGEIITNINVGSNRKEKLIYGLSSYVQFFTYVIIVGLVITIYWWFKNEKSIAERISGLSQ